MKTLVHNYIYNSFNEKGMKTFEKKVSKILKDNCINGNIICHDAWKSRERGYCRYSNNLEIEINGISYFLKSINNDSEMWDNWVEPTTKDKRNLFLALLEDEIKYLKDMILENNN